MSKEDDGVNTDLMFSSKTNLWATPQEFFDELDREFHFTLDVCALPENAKCEKYYTPRDDAMRKPWDGVVWCNPLRMAKQLANGWNAQNGRKNGGQLL